MCLSQDTDYLVLRKRYESVDGLGQGKAAGAAGTIREI